MLIEKYFIIHFYLHTTSPFIIAPVGAWHLSCSFSSLFTSGGRASKSVQYPQHQICLVPGCRMSDIVVVGLRKPSTILVKDMEPSVDPVFPAMAGDEEWEGKSRVESSSFSSLDSCQPDTADDCASVLLACLYCRFCDMMAMLPETCERALVRCFPSYKYFDASMEQSTGNEGWRWSWDCDCGLMDSCHETSELIELAMEISEVCYR